MSTRLMRSRIAATMVGVAAFGLFAGPALASSGPTRTPEFLGGIPVTTLVKTLTPTSLEAAVGAAVHAQSVPITSAEERRLQWLDSGHLSQMTVSDAAVAEELAASPLTLRSSITQPSAVTLLKPTSATVSPKAVGNCWTGFRNTKSYSDIVGFAVQVQAGVTGFCDGPGNQAIVTIGNYISDIHNGIPDGCNAAGSPKFHHKGEVYIGPNSQWLTQLNTFESGANTPIGCVGSGSDAAAAARETYNGYQDCYDDWNLGWGQPGCGSTAEISGPYS